MSKNIEVVCPYCGSDDYDIYDTDGQIDDGWYIEKCACLEENCGKVWEVKADFVNIRITEMTE